VELSVFTATTGFARDAKVTMILNHSVNVVCVVIQELAGVNLDGYVGLVLTASHAFVKYAETNLVMTRTLRTLQIVIVKTRVVFVGKVFITTLTTGASYFAIEHYVGDELYSIIGPLFFIAAIAWFIEEEYWREEEEEYWENEEDCIIQ